MKWWFLLTVALAGAGCATTAVGSASSDGAQRRHAESPPADVSVETAEREPDQPGVVVVASSPTDVRFHTGNDVVVSIGPVRPRAAANSRAAVREGMMVGALIGVVTGAISGSARDEREKAADPSCTLCGSHAFVDSAALGAIGLGLGAAVTAIVVRLNSQ